MLRNSQIQFYAVPIVDTPSYGEFGNLRVKIVRGKPPVVFKVKFSGDGMVNRSNPPMRPDLHRSKKWQAA